MKRLSIILLFFCCSCFQVFGQSSIFGKAQWITASEDRNITQAPLFRKNFVITGKVKSATLYFCGLGYHDTFVNGKPVSYAVLEQAFTNYGKRLLYNSYDVTPLLRKGENCLSSELGNGWFNMQSHTIWNFDKASWRKSPRLLASLAIQYTNGKKETIVSDQSWKCAFGPSQFNSLHAGEIYDARKEINGWKKAGSGEAGFKDVIVTSSPGGVLVAQTMPPVKVVKWIKPVSCIALGKGKWLVDFGENLAGVASICVKGKAGDTVKLCYAESLGADGNIDRKQNGGHMIGPKSEPEFQTDIYILKGGNKETFTPRFVYHGFRYVEVQAPADIKIDKNSLVGLFYSTGFKRIGRFESSSVMLNKLYAAAIQSYQSNYNSIPTDCPQREKMGWLADAHIACDLGLWNFDAAFGYKKYLADIRDAQLADGRLPGVAPTFGVGYNWIDPKDNDFGPAWGSALPIITWQVFAHTGDKAVILENYAACKLYVKMLIERAKKTGYLYTTGISDFLSIQETPKTVTSTMIVYHDAILLSKMAGILGFKEDQQEFSELGNTIKTAFNAEFFDRHSNSYMVKTLTALSGAIVNGLCPKEAVKNVAAELAKGVRERNYAPDFGVMGTSYVLSALSSTGYADDAVKLLTNPRAGWGKWIAEGATTLYEGWEPKEESKNHVFFGDFAAWYFRSLAGIQLDEENPGFRHFFLRPAFPGNLAFVLTEHQTRFGQLGVKWQRKSNIVEYTVEVPKGTNATFQFGDTRRELTGGKHVIKIKL